MRQLVHSWFAAGLALAGLGFFALMALRRPDIPHAVLDGKYADPRSAFLEGPDGAHIHYRDEGRADGPPVIFVHGFCASLHTWEPWVERLGKHYRLISIDLPGHGLTRTPTGYRVVRDSFARVIDAVADHLGLERFGLVGSSMGGAAAWDYARRAPERVTALALIGAAGWTPRQGQNLVEPALRELLSSPMGPILRDLDNTEFIRKGLRASFADPDLAGADMIERYVELARAPMHREVQIQLATDNAARPYASARLLSAIRAPTLVMHGEADRLVPASDGRRFARAIAGSRLIVYEDVGHIVHEEIPDESAADLHEFLGEHLARRAAPRSASTRRTAAEPALRLAA